MADTKKGLISVLNMASYTAPDYKEERTATGIRYVKWGEKDDYYDDLIELYMSSPTNSRCINGISDMIFGKGLNATDSEEKPSEFEMMKEIIPNDELRKIAHDLKHLGEGSCQIIWKKGKKEILRIDHTPRQTWRAAPADKGVIKKYYYHPDWAKRKPADKLQMLPTFGHGTSKQLVEIYIFKPYRSGYFYYSTVDYHGCIQYCDLEKEISNYHISNIKNGLQPSLLISFANGIPSEDKQRELEKKIGDKYSGSSNAGRFILEFVDDPDDAAKVEAIQIPDAHAQYQYYSDEAREKIMLGHGIGSPILLGIKDNTGFGNNAEEIRTASILMDNHVIRPFQKILLRGIEDILAVNGIELNLYFETLQPIEFAAVDNIQTRIRREEETGEKAEGEKTSEEQLSSIEVVDLSDDEGVDILEQLEGLGEVVSDDWELIHSERVDLAEANPYDPSSQDQGIYKVRYAYMPVRKSSDSRNFCRHMEGYTAGNIVFRKEDINMMSFRGVNNEHGHKGRNYSLFKWKGGRNCHHYWEMRVYKKSVADGELAPSSSVTVNNPSEISERNIDRPDKGRHPNSIN